MGKRNRSRSSSASDYSDSGNRKVLTKRIKRLERELKRQKRRFRSRSSSHGNSHRSRSRDRHIARRRSRSTSNHSQRNVHRSNRRRSRSRASRTAAPPVAELETGDKSRLNRPLSAESPSAALPRAVENTPPMETISACSAVENISQDACSVYTSDQDELELHNDYALPEEVMEILGEDPTLKQQNAFMLHGLLAPRWEALIINGMKREDLANLLTKYDIPGNLSNLAPPKLNPEIAVALQTQKSTLAADASLNETQHQLGKGLCALGKAISRILDNIDLFPEEIKCEVLKCLTDSGQLFSNLFHRISINRQNIITPHLNVNMKEIANRCTISEFLFGSDLSDKLKAIKNIESVSKEFKLPKTPSFAPSKRPGGKGGGGQKGPTFRRNSAGSSRPALNSLRLPRHLEETGQPRGQPSRIQRVNYSQATRYKDQRRRR